MEKYDEDNSGTIDVDEFCFNLTVPKKRSVLHMRVSHVTDTVINNKSRVIVFMILCKKEVENDRHADRCRLQFW